jgi:Flp pilus assembly pilin Flp
MMLKKLLRNRKGQGLVEYALIIAGVALIAAVGISVFGHKVSDLISTVAVVLPGAHADDNAGIVSGRLIETAQSGTNAGDPIVLDVDGIQDHYGQQRLTQNLWGLAPTTSLTPEPPSYP